MAGCGKSFNPAFGRPKNPSDAEKRSIVRRNVQKRGHPRKIVQRNPGRKISSNAKNVQPHGETLKNRVIRGKTFKSPHLDPPERICSARSFGAATISPTVVIWTASLRWLQVSPHATTVPPPGWARDRTISTCSTSPGRVGRGIRARHCVQSDLRLWAGRRRRETAVRERCASRWRQAGIMPSPRTGGPSKGLRSGRQESRRVGVFRVRSVPYAATAAPT